MKTLTFLCTLLFLWVNYKIYKDTPKDEKFNPLNQSILIWLIWAIGALITLTCFIIFCIT